MARLDVGQRIQLLANVGVLAGVLFLAYELRQNTIATQMMAVDSYLTNAGSLSTFIAGTDGFAEIVLKAQQGQQLSDAEALRLDVFSIHVLRTYQNVHFQYLNGVLDEELWESYRSNLARTLTVDRPLLAYWRDNRSRLTPAFNELMERIAQEVASE